METAMNYLPENDTRSGRRFACRLYPSHGPLRFITSHSFRPRLCHAKNEAPEEEAGPAAWKQRIRSSKPHLFETVFSTVFYRWIRRICEFRRVDDWRGIFSNSVMCAVSFHPDSFYDEAWVLCTRTPIQGTRYVEASRLLTEQAKTCLGSLYY